jgi:hypothetical protein
MSQSSIPSSRPTFSVIGSGRATAGRPEPPSHASTSVSDISSDIYRSPPSMGTTFTPSSPSLSGTSSNISHLQHFNGLPVRSPQPSTPPPPHPQHLNANFATYTSAPQLSSSPSPPPGSLPVPVRAMGPAGPVTPAHRNAHALLHARLQSRQAQRQQPQPPSSVRSKTSVAETPSGDLANFQLLNGSPLQSVADLDTPTPSPRTPSMPSVSPADAQAYALASHTGGGAYLPFTTERRFLSGSSVSPSFGRGQRAVATSTAVKSIFYCRMCGADPCLEITATGCGHIFCNQCIIEEVRENARCPVCNAAVLLFALLKLDVS